MEQVRISDIKTHTFGWIQNPSDFLKLKKTVQIFDHVSQVHDDLKINRIPLLIAKKDGRDRFIKILNTIPLKIKYKDLIGTSFLPRSSGRCNSIVQAIIEGQKKPFTDNWTAEGFIRWAHALGFIDYDYLEDSFFITKLGFDLSRSKNNSKGEKEILIDAMLSYPPVFRVLSLLSSGELLTKFDIGKQLGFTGESGFTSYPLNIFISSLAYANNKEKAKIRQSAEGSSDKYARMISGWLVKLGLVVRLSKEFNYEPAGKNCVVKITHAYKITGEGMKQLRRTKVSTNTSMRINKRVCWEMFATKSLDKNYIRSRRAYILKFLDKNKGILGLSEIQKKLQGKNFIEEENTIKNDIQGLINIGLNIEVCTRGFSLKDTINDFLIPVIELKSIYKSDIEADKSFMRQNLKLLPSEYIELIEISQDPKQNRIFEIKVMELFINEFGFNGTHLGGSRKPDGVLYTDSFGIIVDTKAYSEGYSLPISQADEMERYIRENIERNVLVNSNKWWETFPDKVNEFKFLFVTGYLTGNFEKQLNRINLITGVQGGAINIKNLLFCAEYIKMGILNLCEFKKKFDNNEIKF